MTHLPKLTQRLLFLVLVVLAVGTSACTQATRHEEVAERGAMVMPFDLDRSTHIFQKQDTGGLQQVVSDDADSEQIRLIHEHLAHEAERFQSGDFHDPAMIHGDDMAGLHTLIENYDQLEIVYSEIENGGQIVYTSADQELITAIHAWFDQQLSDHGAHASE